MEFPRFSDVAWVIVHPLKAVEADKSRFMMEQNGSNDTKGLSLRELHEKLVIGFQRLRTEELVEKNNQVRQEMIEAGRLKQEDLVRRVMKNIGN